MHENGTLTQRDSDLRNPTSYALTDFFDLVLLSMRRKGYKKREARAYAYDAVELRFNISKSRARNIMYAVRNDGDARKRMLPVFYFDNLRLIELLQNVNEEYTQQKRNR